jgi:tetratricopeptide (TPR) repeat protein/serine/threonine protein kinase
MNAEFRRVKEIFLAAVEKPTAAERDSYLHQVCGTNEELRRQVDALLGRHVQAGSFLEHPPASPVMTINAPSIREEPGAVIGPYKLLEQLGEGGFGVVFMAEQTEPVRRKVALKILKPGMDTRQVVARFEAERQALAIMDHPNIATVFDGGATVSGRPFFVMELVRGVPMTDFCDQNHLTPGQRLELFMTVCQAVQHAHQKGIIHRDLKPSNILVAMHETTPVVKVIDFGVAKALGQELTDKTLFTGLGQMVGTPLYMSPEQAGQRGLDIDTRSDIYSLGVLLYELLTGTTPFDRERFRNASHDEICRIIREEEPPRPSTRLAESKDTLPSISAQRHTDPAKLTKLVRRELDWIVMKCLEKDRNRRYETASGLAMDVQRYLADEPVGACPPSVGYRLRKFVRRNNTGLALVGTVVLFLVVLASVVGWTMRDREAREQEIAGETARKLSLTEHGIRDALDQVARSRAELHALLRKPGGVQEFVNKPSRWELFIRSGQAELAHARRLTEQAEGRLDAELMQALDRVQARLADDEADRLLALDLEEIRLERATWIGQSLGNGKAAAGYARALADFRVLTNDPGVVAARVQASPIKDQLVAAVDDWAYLAVLLRDLDRAERLLAVTRAAAPDPTWGDRVRQLKLWRDKEALSKLAAEAPLIGLSPQILNLLAERLPYGSAIQESWLRRAQAEHPADFWLNFNLAYVLGKKKPADQEAFFRVALAVRPGNSVVYYNLGNALLEQKRMSEAVVAYQKAIERRPNSPEAHCNMGNALRAQLKFPEAIAAYKKAIELDPKAAIFHTNLGITFDLQEKYIEAIAAYQKAIACDPDSTPAYTRELAPPRAHIGLGVTLLKQKKLPEAIAALEEAVKLDPKSGLPFYHMGNVCREQNKLPQAVAAYREAIRCNPEYAPAYRNLGIALAWQENLTEAIAAYQKAIALDPTAPRAHFNLGIARAKQRMFPEAILAFQRTIELLQQQERSPRVIRDHEQTIEPEPGLAAAYMYLGSALAGLKKLPESIAAYEKAIEIDPKSPKTYYNLGTAHREQRRPSDAIRAFQKAIELDPTYADAHRGLGLVLAEQGKPSEAIAAYEKAIALDPNLKMVHYHLGNALRAQHKLADATIAYRKAIELAPDHPEPHCNLGHTLKEQGRFTEALAAFEKGDELGRRTPGWSYPSAAWVKECKSLIALDQKLPGVLKAADADAAEQIALADLCLRYKKQYRDAATLYDRAFAAQPKLAEELQKGHRYNAARAAALASTGQETDAGMRLADERARLRRQALGWLKADLAAWALQLENSSAPARTQAAAQLRDLHHSSDFQALRDPAALAALPEDEQRQWRALWDQVATLLPRANGAR